MSACGAVAVVKVGGSLYDLPALGPGLRQFLGALSCSRVILVPGGGPSADVIRDFDRLHGLGETVARVLALRALTLNAHFLAQLLGQPPILNPLCTPIPQGICLLDAAAFCASDTAPGALPCCWQATSDSVAARLTVLLDADRLILLKSTDLPQGCWQQATRQGVVDPQFLATLSRGGEGLPERPRLELINFRVQGAGAAGACGWRNATS